MNRARGSGAAPHHLSTVIDAEGLAEAAAWEGAEILQRDTRGRNGPQHCVIRARGAGDARNLPEAIDGDGLAEGAARKGAEVLHGDTRGCHGPQRGVSHARGRSGAAAHHLSTVIDAKALLRSAPGRVPRSCAVTPVDVTVH